MHSPRCPLLTYRTYNVPSKYCHTVRLPWIPSEKRGCLWFTLKRNRSFPLSTLPILPWQVEQKDPSHAECHEERKLPALPERDTPSSEAGEALQRYPSSLERCASRSCLQPRHRRSRRACQSEPSAQPPPSLPTAQGGEQKEAITGDLAAQSGGCVTPTYRS